MSSTLALMNEVHPSHDDTTTAAPRTFEVGERVLVHGSRFPFALRPGTVVHSSGEGDQGGGRYTVELGMGGVMDIEQSEMHHGDETGAISSCRRCHAGPDGST
jgi:hypothetical protein